MRWCDAVAPVIANLPPFSHSKQFSACFLEQRDKVPKTRQISQTRGIPKTSDGMDIKHHTANHGRRWPSIDSVVNKQEPTSIAFQQIHKRIRSANLPWGERIRHSAPRSHSMHYLTERWCLKPKVIDKNRYENGDYYKKPTQYWFIGFNPLNQLVFEPIEYVQLKIVEKENQVQRSMIHPQYASRFIRQYILPEEMWRKLWKGKT